MPKRKARGCPVHGDANHGGEAEELRKGIERILERSYDATRKVDGDDICLALQKLLDDVDARDSLAWLERHDEKHEQEAATLKARIAELESADAPITVCDKCLRACCWKGVFLCDDSYSAGTIDLPVSALRELDREHSDYWDGTYERNEEERHG